jgi:hypothetical protein
MTPHPDALRVNGLDYWAIKKRIMNGKKVTEEQAHFVGFEHHQHATAGTRVPAWLPAAARAVAIDKQLEEVDRLRDIATR